MLAASAVRRLLSLGLLATFLSGFGQTFLIGMFSGEWREEFGLTASELGSLYSGATLLSGLIIVKVGRWIDVVPLERYVTGAIAVFALACVLTATATAPWILFIGLFLLRQCGQGLMGHIAMTTVARSFSANRGRALSIAQLGFPAAEALFPIAVVAGLAIMDWRSLWWIAAAALALLLPVFWRLSKGLTTQEVEAVTHSHDASRREVLRDRRFYLILPVILTTAFVVTGLFFHQKAVADAKGWPLSQLAAAFIAYAAAQVGGGLLMGWLIDRHTARRLLRGFLFPMAAGCLVLAYAEDPRAAYLYMALLGLSAGAGGSLFGALWAELYGTRHLGAIRAMQHALMVVASAGAPILFGHAFDAGVSIQTIALLLAGYCAVVAPLLGGAASRESPLARPDSAEST